jgi:hypothetical protein
VHHASNFRRCVLRQPPRRFHRPTRLGAFGIPDGTPQTGPWSATSGSVQIDVTASLGGLRIADNFASIFEGGQWILAMNSLTAPYPFQGHFDPPPNTSATSAIPPGSPGDHLMGLYLNGTTSAAHMTVSFDEAMSDLGFRLASNQLSTYDATIRIFSGMNATGAMIGEMNLSAMGAGGCVPVFRPRIIPDLSRSRAMTRRSSGSSIRAAFAA